MIESSLGLTGYVVVIDSNTGQVLLDTRNAVVGSGKKLVMDFLRGENVDGIQVLALEDSTGEIFRKEPTDITDPDTNRRQYTFFLTESEPSDPPHDLTKLKLMADNATVTLDTGIEYASVDYERTKDINQSLTIYWTVIVQ